jgi:hypothetical protein
MQHALQVGVAHAHIVYVLEGIAQVIDAGTALADTLSHQPCAPVQVELAHIGRVLRIGDESERPDCLAAAQAHLHAPRLVHLAGHLTVP